jgi:putative transposase
MSWNETDPMTEKLKFIVAASQPYPGSFSELCASFGITRQTGYKWLLRYESEGPAGLLEKSRRPISMPNQLPDEIVSLLISARKEHPTWGPKKLRAVLEAKQPDISLPAPSTISDWLKKYGLIRPRKRRLRVPLHTSPLALYEFPNEVWCTDFKGHFAMNDGIRCYPLTLMDGHSRYLLKCEGLLNQKEETAKPHFELAFREFGLPRRIRSDNGVPFASIAIGGLSSLSVWWIKLGIIPERIEPGCPEQNGRHERMHRTLKEETASPPKDNLRLQQKSFDLFRKEYNEERPHEALHQETPKKHYILSSRVFPAVIADPIYPEGFEVKRIKPNGSLYFKGTDIGFGAVLAQELVGFSEVGNEEWVVYFGPVKLGRVTRRGKVTSLKRE